jgi:hypothetical protein
MALAMTSYVFFYLAVGALVVQTLRRFRPVPAVAGAALTAALAAAGSLIPNFFVMTLSPIQYKTYEIWQITDPFTTTMHISKDSNFESPVLWVVVTMAGIGFLLTVRLMARSVSTLAWLATNTHRQSSDADEAGQPAAPWLESAEVLNITKPCQVET